MVLREDSASYQTGGAGDGEGDGVTEGVEGGAAGGAAGGGGGAGGAGGAGGGAGWVFGGVAGVVGADPPLPPSVDGGSVLSGFGVSSGFSPESVGCAMFGSASSGPAPATDPPSRSRAWRACLVTWPAWPPAGRSWWLSANGPPPRATESSDDSTPSSAILKLWRRGELVVSWRNRRRNVRSRG